MSVIGRSSPSVGDLRGTVRRRRSDALFNNVKRKVEETQVKEDEVDHIMLDRSRQSLKALSQTLVCI